MRSQVGGLEAGSGFWCGIELRAEDDKPSGDCGRRALIFGLEPVEPEMSSSAAPLYGVSGIPPL